MFERYTERARRVLFFARYDASQLGSISIETEHLLLGLMREGKGLSSRIFARAHLPLADIRSEIERRSFREKVSASVAIPFSAETKRVLGYAADEAARLRHGHIGTEHLLLGLLREERSVAASVLMDKGMRLDTVREDVVTLLNDPAVRSADGSEASYPRPAGRMLPHYLPSHSVHVAYSTAPPGNGPRVETYEWSETQEPVWGALHFTLRQIVALAWDVGVAQVRLDSPREHDESLRYDFMIALPKGDSRSVIPDLLRNAIQQQLDVDVTRDDSDPLVVVIRPR